MGHQRCAIGKHGGCVYFAIGEVSCIRACAVHEKLATAEAAHRVIERMLVTHEGRDPIIARRLAAQMVQARLEDDSKR